MSLTGSLFTGLTGLDVHSRQLDVIGNNITNVSTPGYKAGRAMFETQLSLTPSFGSSPNGELGGSNPNQIGLGALFSGILRNHGNGTIQATGVNTDLAIDGAGFFITRQGNNQFYTRAGQFDRNSQGFLVHPSQGYLQGFGVDANFNIIEGPLTDLNIPIGTLTLAEATGNVALTGNLNSNGATATRGSTITSQAFVDLGAGGAAATGATLLTNLSTDGATPRFAAGDIITVANPEVGGTAIGSYTFEVGAAGGATTADAIGDDLDAFMTFLQSILGLDASVGGGVDVDAGGQVVVSGNLGEANDILLESAMITSSGNPTQPFTFTKDADGFADGESIRTDFIAYDSLGAPLQVAFTMTKTAQDSSGTTWTYNAYSNDASNLNNFLGSGTILFDNTGLIADISDPQIDIDRSNTGALSPLTIQVDFQALSSRVSPSGLAAAADGTAVGTLESFGVNEQGVITGAFSNGQSRPLGQIALATFTNPEGLVEVGANRFQLAPNSGPPIITPPLGFATGRIIGAALELSNVDLSLEFVNLITASTGFSASSRVITTSDELLQQLLLQL